MQDSTWALLTWRQFEMCRVLCASQRAPLIRLLHALLGVYNGNQYGRHETRRAYEAHDERVRELVSRETLLEIVAEDELWGFLQREKRESAEYPSTKEDLAKRAGLEQTRYSMVRYLLLVIHLLGVVLVGGVFLYTYGV